MGSGLEEKHPWKSIAPVIDGLNNALACHLCPDVAVSYFNNDSDMAFGIRPPSLWL